MNILDYSIDLTQTSTGPIRVSDLGLGGEADRDLIMVVRGYFDDSGDDKRKRFVAVGGLIGNQTQWNAMQIPWCLATADLKGPFHSTDVEAQRDCAENLTRTRCDKMMRDLVQIVEASHLVGIGSVIPIAEYRAVFPCSRDEEPYLLAMKHTIIQMGYIGRTVADNFAFDSIHIMHEEGDHDSAALQVYKALKAVTTWRDAKYLQAFTTGTKGVTGLQAADLVAREAFKHADNLGVRPTRKPVRALADRLSFHLWTRECLEYLRSKGGPENLEALTSWGQVGDTIPQMRRFCREGFVS